MIRNTKIIHFFIEPVLTEVSSCEFENHKKSRDLDKAQYMRARRVNRSEQDRTKSGWKESRVIMEHWWNFTVMTSCLSYFDTYHFITAETDAYLDGNLLNERISISENRRDPENEIERILSRWPCLLNLYFSGQGSKYQKSRGSKYFRRIWLGGISNISRFDSKDFHKFRWVHLNLQYSSNFVRYQSFWRTVEKYKKMQKIFLGSLN